MNSRSIYSFRLSTITTDVALLIAEQGRTLDVTSKIELNNDQRFRFFRRKYEQYILSCIRSVEFQLKNPLRDKAPLEEHKTVKEPWIYIAGAQLLDSEGHKNNNDFF